MKFRVWDEKFNCWDGSPLMLYPYEDILKQGRTIQWFTGLKDKNGKDIYQGDIVYHTVKHETHDSTYAAEVVLKDFGWCLTENGEDSVPFCYLLSEKLEVIGNIFQLPCHKPNAFDHNGECLTCDAWATDCPFLKKS